jgi:hypothetical protein
MIAALPLRRLIGSFAVDQPRYPEPIDKHAKTRGPERLFERHGDLTVLAKLVKNTLGLSRVLDLEREREAFGFLVAIPRYVAPLNTCSPTVRLPCITLSCQSAGT